MNTYQTLQTLTPHLSLFPPTLNFSSEYLYPLNIQPLYENVNGMMFNVTVISSIMKEGDLRVGKVEVCNKAVDIQAEVSSKVLHYTGSLFLHITTMQRLTMTCHASITLHLSSRERETQVTLPIFFNIASQQRREKRVLWDLYHSVKYPEEGRILRDEDTGSYMFDWRGDHPLTNYLDLYERLVNLGYVVDLNYQDFTCVEAENYGVYLLLDPEVMIEEKEQMKIRYDIERKGVHLFLLADWYDEKIQTEILKDKKSQVLARKDINATFMGSATPTINSLLASYFIELSKFDCYSGAMTIGPDTADYQAGAAITRFPHGGYLLTQYLQSRFTRKWLDVPVLGLYDDTKAGNMSGRIAVLGDSSCFDKSAAGKHCLWLLEPILSFLEYGEVDSKYFPSTAILPNDYDWHKEMDVTIPAIKKGNGSQCFLSDTGESIYHHNHSRVKINTWVSSPEAVKTRENKWMVYLQRGVFAGFLLLAIAVYFAGKIKRREEGPARRTRRFEEYSMVASRRSKTSINTLPIDIQL